MNIYYEYYKSPVGKLFISGRWCEHNETRISQWENEIERERNWTKDGLPFKQAICQLEAFFEGELKSFDLPLVVTGTSFRKLVWAGLMDIPYGETWSYSQLANHIGTPNACRAVGSANGVNPIPIIIPCHRVVGSDGSLTGFGGGLKTKKFLLELESKNVHR